MNHRRCSVKGCSSYGIRMFSFPDANRDLERAIKWLHAAGNEKLLSVPANKLRYRSVCIKHFERNFILSVQLSRYAVPTLNLPEPIDASAYNPHQLPNESQERALMEAIQGQEAVSRKELEPTVAPTYIICQLQNKGQERALTEAIQGQETVSHKELGAYSSSPGQAVTRKKKDPEPSILRTLNISRKMYLTNRELQLYNTACKFKNLANRLKRRNSVLQERLRTVDTLQNNIERVIVDFPEAAKNFFLCQVRNKNVKKMNRSYTQEDLALASAIHKRGPAAYSFLSETFCLPSTETLRKFRNAVAT